MNFKIAPPEISFFAILIAGDSRVSFVLDLKENPKNEIFLFFKLPKVF